MTWKGPRGKLKMRRESRLKKTLKYLKELDTAEVNAGSQKQKPTRKIRMRRKHVKRKLKKEKRGWILFKCYRESARA